MENKKIENCQETGRSSRVLVWVSKEASDLLTWAHLINRFVLIALIAIHILAVFFYFFFKHENLIGPMITGMKRWPAASEPLSAAIYWPQRFLEWQSWLFTCWSTHPKIPTHRWDSARSTLSSLGFKLDKELNF